VLPHLCRGAHPRTRRSPSSLAPSLGVALHDRITAAGWLMADSRDENGYAVTESGIQAFARSASIATPCRGSAAGLRLRASTGASGARISEARSAPPFCTPR
jgi:hypothetical protein